MTNYERIKKMPIDAMADLLMKRCLEIEYGDRQCEYASYPDCRECILCWLEQEAESGD